ncbi:MAG: chemotaxis protein CheD [Spirochaetaceae bacterium]
MVKNCTIKNIFPGEYYVSNRGEVISTILGSCISVCLYDTVNNISGMNHFMLPERLSSAFVTNDYDFDSSSLLNNSLRYGAYSMELLINEIIKLGGEKKYLNAKVFGGGKVLNYISDRQSIGEQNTDFVLAFLKAENIEVISKDVGGNTGRQIKYYTDRDVVYVKNIPISGIPEVEETIPETGKVILFNI